MGRSGSFDVEGAFDGMPRASCARVGVSARAVIERWLGCFGEIALDDVSRLW
jgi:hypothetical protein